MPTTEVKELYCFNSQYASDRHFNIRRQCNAKHDNFINSDKFAAIDMQKVKKRGTTFLIYTNILARVVLQCKMAYKFHLWLVCRLKVSQMLQLLCNITKEI